jgi:hypothetical protein
MDTPPQDAQSSFPPSTGLALASLLLGIAAVGLSFVLIGFLLGAVGFILGYVYLNKKRGPKGMAFWGIGLSALGLLASIGFAVLYYYAFHKIKTTIAAGGFNMSASAALTNPPLLTNSSPLLKSNLVWSANIPGAQTLCAGDWESDGSARVLVAAGQTLHVLDLTGAETSRIPLPERFSAIECGRNKSAGARLLGYTPWGREVMVLDHAGKKVWSQSALMGLDGAHWGDLTGDGNDVLIMGMNGIGGLEVFSGDGKSLWSTSMANVWSQAIVPAATNRPALVLASDASGSVNVFDAAGQRLHSLKPDGGYFAQMTAGLADSNAVQIIGFSGNSVEAFDQTGKTAWITSALSTMGKQLPCAVMGDLKGDGTKQWVFLDGAGNLVVVTTGGLKVSSIPNQSRIQGLAIASRKGTRGLLLTLDSGVVRAHCFGP